MAVAAAATVARSPPLLTARPPHSPASLLRRRWPPAQALADASLLLQDYRTAHEHYALLAADYKAAAARSPTALPYHAHALLLRALAAALADAPRREVEGALEVGAAAARALRVAPAAHWALRCPWRARALA